MKLKQFFINIFSSIGNKIKNKEEGDLFKFKSLRSSGCSKLFYEVMLATYFNNKENIEHLSKILAEETPEGIPDFKIKGIVLNGNLEILMLDNRKVIRCGLLDNLSSDRFKQSIKVLDKQVS